MKKEILYRLIEEVIKESDGAYTIDELKELLRNIKGYDYDAYAQFASLVPFIIEEMSDTLGVVEVIESDSGVPDIKIIFKDAEATKNFARILQSAGLEGSGYPGHYKINKGMSRFKDHPKYHNKSLPSVKFDADHYYKGIEEVIDESNIFNNIRKKKERCKGKPKTGDCAEKRPSKKNWDKATKNEELYGDELEEAEKKPCKPSKGKRFAKRVDGKCRSYGQSGQAKSGGDRIRPGTKKGDAYCARSAGIKKCKEPPCANDLSRKKWKCRGKKSMK